MAWSGGKDCSLALYRLLDQGDYEVVELHTTINKDTNRVGMHGVAKDLILAQSDRTGIPVQFIEIPSDSTNESYEKATKTYYKSLKERNVNHIGFGDIFLEDLKAYRDQMLAVDGLKGIYPLWKEDTKALAKEFIHSGFEAITCAAKQYAHTPCLAGLKFNIDFLQQLPKEVDLCGENGEFHSFVTNGPTYDSPISIRVKSVETHHYNFKDEDGIEHSTSFDFADLRLI